MSLGTPRQTNLLHDLLRRSTGDALTGTDDFPQLGDANVVVVAAAGNTGDTTPQYPAAENINGLIALASSDENDQLSAFSTRGSWIRIAAPGQNILSTAPGGDFATWSETSMASPVVAGEAALVKSAFAGLRADKATNQIARFSARINAPVQARADAAAAVTNAPETGVSVTAPLSDAMFFVRQQYFDFLNRMPDASGVQFWTNEINSCNGDARCVDIKRQNVSAAFFLSTEFQGTGYEVYRFYRTSFNRPSSPCMVPFLLSVFLQNFIQSPAALRGVHD